MVLERLCANATAETNLDIHVVDPYPPGAGRVWRVDQPGDLLMNTVASQVTVFTDDTVAMRGRLVPGPSLYEWSTFHALTDDPTADELGPDTYPTRAQYGRYLTWVFDYVVSTAPAGITVTAHRAQANRLLDDAGGTQTLLLSDGTAIGGLDAAVLAQGHLPIRPDADEFGLRGFAATHGLRYIPPVNPADVDLSGIAPGTPVGLRGLGLCFFDYMALFTIGRGGRFVPGESGLRYEPSGREPRLHAGSRRGVPYHARGENQKGPYGRQNPILLTPETVTRLRAEASVNGGLDFEEDIWPYVAREVEIVFYATTLRERGVDPAGFNAAFSACEWGEAEGVLDEFGLTDRWDWSVIADPLPRYGYRDHADWTAQLLDYLRADVAHGYRGNIEGPIKAALDVLRDLRNEVRLLIDHGGLTGDSYAFHIEGWYSPLNAYLSIGPPARRIEEMVALVEAGVLDVVGPAVELSTAADGFVLAAPGVPGSRYAVAVLIEARLPEISLSRTADPLLRHLLTAGAARHYDLPNPDGSRYRTDGLAVSGRPFHLVDAFGRSHPRRFAFGVPTEAVHWVTAAGARPGVGSVALGDADAISLAVLALPPATPAHLSVERGLLVRP
jgi:hypothetical protein